jgi:hypothetical protein
MGAGLRSGDAAAVALISDGTRALGAGRRAARARLARSPRRLELTGGTGGLAMTGTGARLALTGRNDLCGGHGRLPPGVSPEPDITAHEHSRAPDISVMSIICDG